MSVLMVVKHYGYYFLHWVSQVRNRLFSAFIFLIASASAQAVTLDFAVDITSCAATGIASCGSFSPTEYTRSYSVDLSNVATSNGTSVYTTDPQTESPFASALNSLATVKNPYYNLDNSFSFLHLGFNTVGAQQYLEFDSESRAYRYGLINEDDMQFATVNYLTTTGYYPGIPIALPIAPLTESSIPYYFAAVGSFQWVESALLTYSAGFLTSTLEYSGTMRFIGMNGVLAAVPEPETYAMLGLGLAVISVVARRNRKVTT